MITEIGNDIDVYLSPLIEDLRLLWDEGVEVFYAYEMVNFNLRALLLWTINDFPAYGNLSDYSIKGHHACPLFIVTNKQKGSWECGYYVMHWMKTIVQAHITDSREHV